MIYIRFFYYHIHDQNHFILTSTLLHLQKMKELHNILQEITQITTTIETNYPELYRSLDENPMTLPIINHPHMDKKVMQEYLESLKTITSTSFGDT